MDALKLLSRSTNLRRTGVTKQHTAQNAIRPSEQSVAPQRQATHQSDAPSRKRKRIHAQDVEDAVSADILDFFGQGVERASAKESHVADVAAKENENDLVEKRESGGEAPTPEETRRILKQHKLKATWLNAHEKKRSRSGSSPTKSKKKQETEALYPRPLEKFADLATRFDISRRLHGNVRDQGYETATEVQLAALPLLMEAPSKILPGAASTTDHNGINMLTVAPTGSGKTLAFLLPMFYKIARARRDGSQQHRRTTALVLAPTKELVSQITNEGRKLGANIGIKIAQIRKGMQLGHSSESQATDGDDDTSVKVDILVSTPGILHNISVENSEVSDGTFLPDVDTLVLDEADVLLDPLFREQTVGIWNALPNESLRASLWSATMGSNVEELAISIISERHERVAAGLSAPPLVRLVVGLKDSAVPTVEHKLIYAATEQGKLMGLRQLLHPTTSSRDSGPHLRPPFIVFTQTIERAVALHSELLYDIPAEAGGISRIAVLHSELSDTARDSIMVRFRKGEVWVLITTDLLSRGVDFRGVNGVVNYDIPTSSAAYVHRVGRTGRAGREGGVAVTLYSKEDIPYMKSVANVVAVAQQRKGVDADSSSQEWLLRALPKMNQNDRQKLKKHGVEARTSRGRVNDPRGASKARISTKAGYIRRQENNRKGAVQGSQRRMQAEAKESKVEGDETEFGGFD